MAPPFWINAALRSVIWLGAAAGLAHFKKPDGASLLADALMPLVGWVEASCSPAWLSISGVA